MTSLDTSTATASDHCYIIARWPHVVTTQAVNQITATLINNSCYPVEVSVKLSNNPYTSHVTYVYWLAYATVAPVNCYKVYNS